MTIYQKSLKRLGVGLMICALVEFMLSWLTMRAAMKLEAAGIAPSVNVNLMMTCINEAATFLGGLLAVWVCHHKRWLRKIAVLECMLLVVAAWILLIGMHQDHNTIDISVLMLVLVIFTMLEFGHSEKLWERLSKRPPIDLDLKLDSVNMWFDALVVGPHLELNRQIPDAVDRYLRNVNVPAPLQISVYGAGEVSESLQETMRDVFAEHYMDEEVRITHHLQNLYNRSIGLIVLSLAVLSFWARLGFAKETTVIAMLLSNFAGFSLWQVGDTHFSRSEHYDKLMRVMIAKEAKIHIM